MERLFQKSDSTKQNNNGMSLIEMIVTLLISGIVMLAAVFLFQVASKGYASSTAEQNLQIEAQTVSGVVDDLLREAIDFKYVEKTSGVYSKSALIILVNSVRPTVEYDTVCILYDDETERILLYRYYNENKIKGKTVSECQADIINYINDVITNHKNDFLAKCVTSFTVSPSDMLNATSIVNIDVTLKQQSLSNEFVKSINVSLRNKN